MLKNFRRMLDAGVMRLAGVEPALVKAVHAREDHAAKYKEFAGFLKPVLTAHVESFDNEESSIGRAVSHILILAGCHSKERERQLKFNITVYFLLVFLDALRDNGIFHDAEDYTAFTKGEWSFFLKSSAGKSQKTKLRELSASQEDLRSFLRSVGKAKFQSSDIDLYFLPEVVSTFMVGLRAPFFKQLNSQPSLFFLWQWAFSDGAEERIFFSRAEQGLHRLIDAMMRDLLRGLGIESPKNDPETVVPTSVTLPCPSCNQYLRINIPPPSTNGLCPKCRAEFLLGVDANGGISIDLRVKEFKETHEQDVRDAFTQLGLSIEASPSEIKASYRRLMAEYHPDKLGALGAGIKRLAEEEAKRVNHAMDLLRGAGYV